MPVDTRSKFNLSEEDFNLSEEDFNIIKKAVLDAVIDVLPEVVKDIIPLIIEKVKDLIDTNLSRVTNSQIEVGNQNIGFDTRSFINKEQNIWFTLLDKRNHNYDRFTRCNRLILLYNECLTEEPLYIPKQFRNDNVFVMNSIDATLIRTLDI